MRESAVWLVVEPSMNIVVYLTDSHFVQRIVAVHDDRLLLSVSEMHQQTFYFY